MENVPRYLVVEGAEGRVEKDDGSRGVETAGQGQTLSLSTGQEDTALTDLINITC